LTATLTDTDKVTIGNNLRTLLNNADMSPAEFSRRAMTVRKNWRESLISELLHGKRFPSQEFVLYVSDVYGVNLLQDTGLKHALLRAENEHTKSWLKRTGQRDKLRTPPQNGRPRPAIRDMKFRMFVDKTEKTISLYDGTTYIGTCTAEAAGISLEDYAPGWQTGISLAHIERVTSAIDPPSSEMTQQLEKWVASQVQKEAEASVSLDGETQSEPPPIEEKEEVVTDTPQVTASESEPVTVRISEGVCTVTVGAFSMSMSEGEFTIGGNGENFAKPPRSFSVRHRGASNEVLKYLSNVADQWVQDETIAKDLDLPIKVVRNAGSYLLTQGRIDRSIKRDGHHFTIMADDE